jgi:hypothetical protein
MSLRVWSAFTETLVELAVSLSLIDAGGGAIAMILGGIRTFNRININYSININ